MKHIYLQIILMTLSVLSITGGLSGCAFSTKISQKVPHVSREADTQDVSLSSRLERPVPKLLPRFGRVWPAEVQFEYERFRGNPGVGLLQTMRRAESELPRLARVLANYQIPPDLLIIPFIESNFRPHVKSSFGAAGLWQFMKTTGRHYGLRVGMLRDDRLDPVRSTEAAGKHLSDLYAEFGNWPLVLAAYNSGTSRVKRACGNDSPCDYWRLVREKRLPPQTRRYVPKLIASLLYLEDRGLWPFTRD